MVKEKKVTIRQKKIRAEQVRDAQRRRRERLRSEKLGFLQLILPESLRSFLQKEAEITGKTLQEMALFLIANGLGQPQLIKSIPIRKIKRTVLKKTLKSEKVIEIESQDFKLKETDKKDDINYIKDDLSSNYSSYSQFNSKQEKSITNDRLSNENIAIELSLSSKEQSDNFSKDKLKEEVSSIDDSDLSKNNDDISSLMPIEKHHLEATIEPDFPVSSKSKKSKRIDKAKIDDSQLELF